MRRAVRRLSSRSALFSEALAARRSQLGDSDPLTLTSLNNLGLLLREMGEMGEMEDKEAKKERMLRLLAQMQGNRSAM